MVNKCCVPGCTSNYKSVKGEVPFESLRVFTFPENENWSTFVPQFPTVRLHTDSQVFCHYDDER